ncbi:ferrous iron transporter B, partial [Cohnella sp. REN36]|nr:ferrous iron transporter B [Cohnella sp. REN36]
EKNDIYRLQAIASQVQREQTEPVRDGIVEKIYQHSQAIADEVTSRSEDKKSDWEGRLDSILTSRYLGFPIMLALLGA